MPNPDNSESFNFSIQLVTETLKLQKQSAVESLTTTLTALLGSKSTSDMLTAAVLQLAETDPDTCRWTLRTFSNLSFHFDLREEILMFATKKLMGKGFFLGQDFSVTSTGGIVMTKNAQAALMAVTTASDWLFLEEIL